MFGEVGGAIQIMTTYEANAILLSLFHRYFIFFDVKDRIYFLIVGILLTGLSGAFGTQSLSTVKPGKDTVKASIDLSRPGGLYRLNDSMDQQDEARNRGSNPRRHSRSPGVQDPAEPP